MTKRRGGGREDRCLREEGEGEDRGTEDLLVYGRVAQNAVHWVQTRSRLYLTRGPQRFPDWGFLFMIFINIILFCFI